MNPFDDFGALPTMKAITNLPNRSKLVSLEPIGIGQTNQESLTSYIVRLSRSHTLSPRHLVRDVLGDGDRDIRSWAYPSFFKRFSRTINGLDCYAEQFVANLEKLTSRKDISRLTMIPWNSLFSSNGQGMLSRSPRWCPACLLQFRMSNSGAYFPLAWYLELFEVCPVHHCELEEHCPHCDNRQPFIPRLPDLSICNECLQPLALPIGDEGRAPKEIHEQNLWVSHAIGRMIALNETSWTPGFAEFKRFVSASVDTLTNGNRAAFCRKLGLPKQALNNWLNKDKRPSMASLLDLCLRLDIQPSGLYQTSLPNTNAMSRTAKLVWRAPRLTLDAEKRAELLPKLNRLASIGNTLPLVTVARNLNISRRHMQYWFPDLCKKLVSQYKTSLNARARANQAIQDQRVGEIVRHLVVVGRYPSRRQVDGLLQEQGMSLARPDLMLAYRDALEHVNLLMPFG